MSSGTKKIKCYLIYTLLFAVTVMFVLYYFWRYHKSMVWDFDGVYQHFNSFVYYGKYLREIVRDILKFQLPTVPLWDMCIGYGADILTTLNYYVMGDPLTLLAVFAPADKAEYLYGAITILRLYLAGFMFILYCQYHKNENTPAILGALTYCFSGFALFTFSRHPYFVNPMIYLPLILMGIDKIFKKERPYLYVIMLAIATISNFYFAYMIYLLMIIYAVFRYLRIFKRIRIKELTHWLLKFLGYSLIGVGMSMFALLPALMYLFNTGRMSAKNYIPVLYPVQYYQRLLGDFFCADYLAASDRYYTVLGLVPILLVAVFVLVVKRRKYTDMKLGILLLSILLLIPFAGHIFNGFSYVSNRWIWGYDMLLSYTLVKVWPEIFRLEKKERLGILGLCAVYIVLTAASTEKMSDHVFIALAMLLLCSALAACAAFVKRKWAVQGTLYFLTIAGIGLNVYFLFSPDRTNYIGEYRETGKPYEMLTTQAQNYVVKKIGDESEFHRYDQYGMRIRQNTAMQNRLHGTDFYFSVTNGEVSQFFNDMYLAVPLEQMYDNLDGRSILDRLASVKYFITEKDQSQYAPYGYDTEAASDKKYTVYESDQVLPFGYTFDQYVPLDKFETLTVTEKQQAMLQGVIVDESDLKEAELNFTDVRAEITVTPDENVTMNGNHFSVKKKGAKIVIEFEGMKNCETYLVMEGLDYEGDSSRFNLSPAMNDVEKKVTVYTNKNSFYSGKNDFLSNLGYHEEAPGKIVLKFGAAGEYNFEDFYVVSQPMDAVEEQTAVLKKDILEDVHFTDNEITGSIQLEQKKILVLSMAYSTGWKAYVDGQEQELKNVNVMYAGLELEPGQHTIRLQYCTPYLKEGMLLSAFCVMILIILVVNEKLKRKGRKLS